MIASSGERPDGSHDHEHQHDDSHHDDERDGRLVRRRRIGTVMMVAGVLGLVVALVGTFAGWRLAGNVSDTTGDSIEVTLESLASVEDTIDLSDQVLDAIRETVSATEASLRSVDRSLAAGSDVIGEVSRLTDTVGPSLADVERVLRQLEGVGGTIDDLLGDLSRVPFGPDYDPDQTLAETIGELADTVGELPDQFEATSSDLAEFDRSVESIGADLGELTASLGDVRTGLDDSDRLLDQYRANLIDARIIAENSRTDFDRDVGTIRFAIVVGGLALALGQLVPLWLGRRLRSGDELI